MKKILFALLLVASYGVQAQNQNQLAVKEAEKLGYSGSITQSIGDNTWLNINYSFTPKIMVNELNFSFHTPYPEPISFTILNKSGVKVKEWSGQENEYIKKGTLSISDLKKGTYTIVILHKGIEAKRFNIQKN